MGFFDSLFKKKPDNKTITKYNYYLNFDYLPKKLKAWSDNKVIFQSVIMFDSLANINSEWKALIKDTDVTTSSLKQYPDIMLYLIKSPSTNFMGEVAMSIAAVNTKSKKYIYYTMEHSVGCFAICSADAEGNHYNVSECADGEGFGAFVIKEAMKELTNKPTPKPQPKTSTTQSSLKMKEGKLSFDDFVESLDQFFNNYYEERGVVRIEDYVVARLEGTQVKLYITQNPELDFNDPFNDPDCQVQLMIEFMDYPNRVKMAEYFFRPYDDSDRIKEIKENIKQSDVKDKYYSLAQLKQVQMGALRLQPIDAGIVFNAEQQNIVLVLANKSPRIKKYLPNLDLSSTESIAKTFMPICQKTEMGIQFGYAIKMNELGDLGYMGFIFVHTPTLNKISINFPHWTIDFCLFEGLEGKGTMKGCLFAVLSVLKKEMNVNYVYCIIDEDNTRCLKLMEKLPFIDTGEVLYSPTGQKAKLFCCILKNITFTKPVVFS